MPRIGTSDLDVFPLALGGNTFGWTSDEDTSFAVLDAFVEAGGNLIDTADVYSIWMEGSTGGDSEAVLGRWTAARRNRDQVLLATKVGAHPDLPGLSADTVARAVEGSLTRLGTDRIDLYWAHRDDPCTPLEETVAAFDALVTAGTVRYVGLSNYSAARITEWIGIAQRTGAALPVALQPHYNLVHRTEYEQQLLPVVEEHDLGVLPYFALASGFLTGKYRSAADAEGTERNRFVTQYFTDEGFEVVEVLREVASAHGSSVTAAGLAWLQGRPGVVAPIASASSLRQLPDLMAASAVVLTPQEVARLDEVSARVQD